MTKLEFTPEMDVSPTPSSLDGLHPKFCSFFLFYCPMGHFEWAHHPKKLKVVRLHKMAVSMWGWIASLSAQLYTWEGEDFGQRIWDKSEVLWGTPLMNTSGTHWEQDGNMIIENFRPSWLYIQSSHWLHACSILRHACHHFISPPQMPLLQSTP
jgi:hypothetical protein